MEFVEGEDLRALIHEKKKLPPEEAVEITEQICRALEATHTVGVIHRDLKPQNIMRDNSGRILLMDFGLARTVEGDGMTQTGALVGTMEYMSPEQALAKNLDQRSDLFTLGLILYELLTGKTPYTAESVVASLIKRTQERAIPVSDHDGTIPAPLSNIVSKCLERDPFAARPPNAARSRCVQAKVRRRAFNRGRAQTNYGRRHWGCLVWQLWAMVSRNAFRAAARKPRRCKLYLWRSFHLKTNQETPRDWLGPSLADMLTRMDNQRRAYLPTGCGWCFDLRIAPNAAVVPPHLGGLQSLPTPTHWFWGDIPLGDQILSSMP